MFIPPASPGRSLHVSFFWCTSTSMSMPIFQNFAYAQQVSRPTREGCCLCHYHHLIVWTDSQIRALIRSKRSSSAVWSLELLVPLATICPLCVWGWEMRCCGELSTRYHVSCASIRRYRKADYLGHSAQQCQFSQDFHQLVRHQQLSYSLIVIHLTVLKYTTLNVKRRWPLITSVKSYISKNIYLFSINI